jgi:hypothetical protein
MKGRTHQGTAFFVNGIHPRIKLRLVVVLRRVGASNQDPCNSGRMSRDAGCRFPRAFRPHQKLRSYREVAMATPRACAAANSGKDSPACEAWLPTGCPLTIVSMSIATGICLSCVRRDFGAPETILGLCCL